jgi:sulfatase maturation enzyme AslB (radical SAM superfamily)
MCNAATEPRKLEELERERAELERKRCDSRKYTVRQRKAFHREKRHLDYLIRDKKIANFSLIPVIEFKNEQMITRWVPSSESKKQIKRAKAYSRRTLRAHRKNLESFDQNVKSNPRQSRGYDDRNLLCGRSPCGVSEQTTQSVETLAPDLPGRPNATYMMQVGPWAKA